MAIVIQRKEHRHVELLISMNVVGTWPMHSLCIVYFPMKWKTFHHALWGLRSFPFAPHEPSAIVRLASIGIEPGWTTAAGC